MDSKNGKQTIIPWNTFALEAFLFSLALILGIITAFNWNEIFAFQKIQPEPISFWKFLFYFFFGTLAIFSITLLGKRFQNQKIIFFKVFFLLTSVLGMLYLFFPFIDIFSLPLILVLIYGWLKKPTVLLNNLCFIFGLAGFSGTLGLYFQPLVLVFLLIIFSIYDFIAVYKTKHMVKMAKEMLASKVIFGLVIPQKISGFKENLKEVEPGRFLILGGGDVAFPLLLSASLIPSGILNSLIVAAFSLGGLFLSFYIFSSQKMRQPIPALPPIALFSIIGFLIAEFL